MLVCCRVYYACYVIQHEHKSIDYHSDKQLSIRWPDNIDGSLISVNASVAARPTHHSSTIRPVLKFTSLLQQSLYECSINMGISRAALAKNWDTFSEVSRRAGVFLDAVAPLLPRNFSTQFKNPCWEAEKQNMTSNYWEEVALEKFSPFAKLPPGKGFRYSQYLMKPAKEFTKNRQVLCLPYFFLAGFPKSGTTTVHDVLSLHPNIIAPKTKEPHWWTRALDLRHSRKFSTEYVPISLIWYTISFKALATEVQDPEHEELITYDGSQSTLWDSNFYVNEQDYCAMPAVMCHILPDAKFVVVLRNPVTRLYSHFAYSCLLRHGRTVQQWPQRMRQGMAKLFHSKVEEDIDLFNNCVKNASVLECSSIRTANTEGPKEDLEGALNCTVIWHRLTIGMYVVHIKKWLQFYPIKNFLFIKMEDFFDHSRDILSNITNFLGINRGYRGIAEILRQHKNSHPLNIQPMDFNTSQLLQNFYRPYNEELAKLLNDKRFLWED